ncbi:obscurin-like protein 1 isoform X10 [Pseudoliparis swirei]|uniref:obscurin-like protein 1 isoform X10 n=1 Tax=Pseudoliparis swirei TaxID=2059687 RepID=UPI0024BEAE3D|nr:obscurin-like protein 1 isoform X10 [Pseudoliparis swirei]
MDVFGGAPRFFAYPRPVVVQSGTDAVLKCQIGGDPRPAVIWERNNEKIDPQGQYRIFEDGNVYNLIISAATAEDSGQYMCKAKNSIGETYAAATLKVEGEEQEMEVREENKPLFLIKPLSTRAGRGNDAVFSCKLWGNPQPEVVWEKDGRKLNEIFESTHFNVGFQDGGWFQLKIFKTRAPDGGVYTCKARNKFGEALAGAVLLVDAGPGREDEANRNGYTNGHWKGHQGKQRSGRQVANRLKDDTKSTAVKMFAVTEGKHAKFRCFVTGKPKPEIIWRKDGRMMLSGRRYLLYEDREGYFTLKVLYCKQKDNGVYVCAASNTAGQTLSAVHLSVKEPPVRFKQPLSDLEVWEQDLAVLECEVPEDSVPITWYLEDRRLQPGDKYGMEEWGTKRRLTIRDIGVDDDGIYLCEMPDGGRSIAEVAVKGTILRKLPRKVDVLEGENAAFCVEVEKEEMDIHWYKDAVELRETHQTILKSFGRTHILVFVNTMPQDSGLVTFLVGRSKTSSQLRVKAARHSPPSCPVGVQINTEHANAALLSWLPAQDTRKNPPSGYVLERQEMGTGSQEWLQCLTTDSATSVEILGDSVPCEADYRFRICSVNKYGKSNNVEFPKAAHLVPVTRIQAPLQDALVPEGQDALFSIELSASVIGTWFLNGTQVQEEERYSMRRSRTHQSLRIRGVREAENGAEITFIAYGIRDSAALYIQAPLVKFSFMSEMDRNKFVEIGNPIVLYCELSDPATPVHWYKNGVKIQTLEGQHIQSEGTMRRIVIQSAEFSHSGVYCCDAIDDVIRFNVEVEAPPVRFSAIPDAERNKTIETGSPIALRCELSDPSAQVHWYKDGSKLQPQTGVDILTDGLARKLIVHSAESFHSGLYCCKTKGDAITFSVDVKAPPVKFSAIPEDMRTKWIDAGCPVALQCAVSDPEADVCWHKDEVQLIANSGLEIHSEGNTRTLVVQSAELCHSGVYRCSTQDDTLEFQVEIKAIPVTYSTVFDVERTKSLEEGKPLELECEVDDPTVPVCWYKDGVKLTPQNDWDIQSYGTMRRLIIPAAELSHSGLYICETSDDTIHFTVDIKAPTLPLSPSPEVVETQSLEATCPPEPTCDTSDPAVQVSLQRDEEHHSYKKPNLETGGIKKTLVIEPTHPSNSGAYYCATADDVAQLIVNNQAPPVRITALCDAEKNKSVEVDEPIMLRCEISDPNAQVKWYKDGITLREAAGQDMLAEGSIRTLAFQSAMPSHAGIYSCKTTDDAMQFHVDVKVPLLKFSALSEGDQQKTVMAGFPIVLQCELSESTGQVSWYKDGTKLLPQNEVDIQSEGNLRSLVVQSAERAHSGVYRCESKDDDVQFAVEVTALPVKFSELPETDKSKSVQEGSTIVLSCEISHNPSAYVDWYKDGLKLLPQNKMEIQSDGLTRTLLIHSAEHIDGGTYECSTADDTITFKVDLEGRSPQIMPIPLSEKYKMIAMGCPIILQCEVSDPVAQVSWFKDEVELFCRTGLDMKRDGSLRKLTIHSAKVSDSGLYSCSLAEDVVTFHVDVKASPVRFSERQEIARNTFVEAGCPMKPQCEVSEPTAQVYWHKDGEQLLPKSEYEIQIPAKDMLRALVITPAEVIHSGVHSCEAADDHIEFKVDVAAVTEAERSKSVEAGSLISLQREIADHTGQTDKCEDGINLSQKLGTHIESEGNMRTLAVKSDTSSSSGVYSCKTNDDSGFNDFYVEVKAPPVTFADIPEEDLFKSVVEQEQFVLSCEVSRADGVVQWYKDGIEMQPCDNMTTQAEGTKRHLAVHSAQLSDTGTYTCRAGDNVLMYKVNIREPPVLIIYPKEDVNLDRLVPEEIILSCELSRPNGVVGWYKDGQKLQESENIKLKIEGPYRRLKIISSGVEDSGEYVCDTADASIFFHLGITEPPVQIVSPSQSQMELCQQSSERMVLSCEISRPNAVVRWYRDGLEVEENNNLILEVDGVYRRLIIPETTVKDSAEYVCDTADDSMTFFVNIAEPPVRFVRPRKMPGRVDKVAGETLVLECEVSRSNAEVTWKKNGEEVGDSRNITILEDGLMRQLTVHSLTMEDAGQYVCDAKDDVMDFHVKVQELPVKILGKTDSKTEKQFLLSDDIILVCELSRSNASVSWYKDNQPIDDTERYCSEEQGVFRSLVVLNAALEDSGEYTCDAVDDKMVFYITVKEPQVHIIGNSGHPEHHILVAGDDLILECEVSRPNATVQWLCNGEVLKPDTRIKIDSYDVVRKLVLSGLRPSDSGKYICDAIDDKLTTIVEVQEPLVKFENKNANNRLSAYENESVTMCAIVSRERANIRWLKDGQLLTADNVHISSEGNTHKLTINPLQLSDSGEYVCDVKTDEMYFNLLVKEMRVKFTRTLESIASLKGSNLILRCEVNKPKGDVQWMKNGQEISPSRRHTIRAQGRERSFTVHQLVEEDAGEYACESTDDKTSATVTVETRRVVEFIAELRNIAVCEGEDAVFKCVVSPEDTRLVWRLNGKRVTPTQRTVISSNGLCHMLCIHNCAVSDGGRVTADAEGSVSKAELQIQEHQVLFTKKMTPVVAQEYGEVTLEVEVGLDSGEVQWMRQGVLIHPGPKSTLKHNGRSHSLTLHKLAISDRGTYSCETLHDRTQAQLTVEPRKIGIIRGMTDIKTTERETASFEVELSYPDVPGTWMRNAIKLKPSNRFRMSAKGQVHSLTVSHLSVEDSGTFTFCVENLKTSARLVVKEPPVTIFRKLEDQRFPEGAVISIECELSRHSVGVKWMKNGVEVKSSKDLRIYAMGRKRYLQIMKCKVSDSGMYTCDAGDVSTCCTVEVYERDLMILQGPKDLDIQEDQNAVFVCELSVEDMPGQWYKNGERIQPTSTIKIRQEGTKHFLLMCNVKAEDSGEIKFVSRHIQSVAYLEVEELPVNIVKPLQDTTAVEESRVLLDCTVSNPRCSIRWYKGCNVILPSERFEICSEGCSRKLILQQVVLDDEGMYSVQVGEYSCSAKLTVEALPLSMVRELKDVEVVAPDEARFECEVSRSVLRAPVWSLNGEPLQQSARVLLEKMDTVHRMTFRPTCPDMSGEVEFTSGRPAAEPSSGYGVIPE